MLTFPSSFNLEWTTIFTIKVSRLSSSLVRFQKSSSSLIVSVSKSKRESNSYTIDTVTIVKST